MCEGVGGATRPLPSHKLPRVAWGTLERVQPSLGLVIVIVAA